MLPFTVIFLGFFWDFSTQQLSVVLLADIDEGRGSITFASCNSFSTFAKVSSGKFSIRLV